MRRLLLFLLLFTPAYGQVTNTLTLSKLQYSGNTFTLAGTWDFTGRMMLPKSTTPPAADCNEAAEAGRMYFDTDATTGTRFLVCEGASGWVTPAGSGGAPAFSAVQAGTNTTAAMLVGAGASLVPSSTGTITATNVSTGLLANCTGSNIAGEFRVRATGTGAMANFCTGQGSPVLQYLANGDSTGNAVISNDAIHATSADLATAAYSAAYLASDGTNCSAGQFAAGIDPNGNAQGCATPGGGTFLPLAGGTMTGTETTKTSGTGIILPAPASSGPETTEIRFDSFGPYTKGNWFISNTGVFTGVGSEDHVLRFAYNMKSFTDSSALRDVDGEHAWNLQLESGYSGGACDPNGATCVGNAEINWNIYPEITGVLGAGKRPLFAGYTMGGAGQANKASFFIGDIGDPNSILFKMEGLPTEGNYDMGFGLIDAGMVVYNRHAGADGTFDAPGRLLITPGLPYTDANRQAIISLGFALPSENDLNIEPGRASVGGTVGAVRFGYYRGANVNVGQLDAGRFTIDGNEDEVQMLVQGHSTQTNLVALIEKSDGTDLFSVANSGDVKVLGNTVLPVPTGLTISNSSGILGFNFTLTLAGNPAFNAEECAFTTAGTGGGGFICEGSTGGNGNEQLHLFPALDGADTTDFIVTSAAAAMTETKCINVDPNSAVTDFLFFRAENAITVTGIDCLVDSATSLVLTLKECDGNGGSCGTTEAAITCGTTNTTEAAGIDDAAIDAGDYMRVVMGTKTGTPTQAILCMNYTVN